MHEPRARGTAPDCGVAFLPSKVLSFKQSGPAPRPPAAGYSAGVFESASRLSEEVRGLIEALRTLADGRYAALFDRKGVLLEVPAAEADDPDPLRRFLQNQAAELLRIPAALHGDEAMEDAFEGWSDDEFFLAFVNGKVGLLVACPDAQRLEDAAAELLRVLVDRLLRLNAAWRLDEKGRGLFVGRPRLDTIVVSRPAG